MDFLANFRSTCGARCWRATKRPEQKRHTNTAGGGSCCLCCLFLFFSSVAPLASRHPPSVPARLPLASTREARGKRSGALLAYIFLLAHCTALPRCFSPLFGVPPARFPPANRMGGGRMIYVRVCFVTSFVPGVLSHWLPKKHDPTDSSKKKKGTRLQ